MPVNIGSIDRMARILAGAALILLVLFSGLAVFGNPFAFWITLMIGLVLVLTGLIRTCPLYLALGLSTSKVVRK